MPSDHSTTPRLPSRISLVSQTVQSLRDGIATGHWRECLPGERELCERLHVSRRTLRGALQQLEREGSIEKGLQRQARKIKAVSALAAPRSKAAKSSIAVLSPCSSMDLPAPTMSLLSTLRGKIMETGRSVEFHVRPACFSEKPGRALNQLVTQHPGTSWLIVGSKEPMQRWFIERRLPCLVIGSCGANVALPSVDLDYRATCRHAGGVLWRKGHKHIALITPQDAYGGDLESENGLRESLHPLRDADLLVVRHNGTSAHLCRLLDETLRRPKPPTAFLVVGAKAVVTVMMHLMKIGVRIPQDAAVLARDDDPYLQATSPPVAYYAINRTQVARRLARAARQLAETGSLPATAIRLVPTFVPGETL